jgi:hypothetical protein
MPAMNSRGTGSERRQGMLMRQNAGNLVRCLTIEFEIERPKSHRKRPVHLSSSEKREHRLIVQNVLVSANLRPYCVTSFACFDIKDLHSSPLGLIMEVVGLIVYACDYPINYVVRIHL